jgi:copper homeostasis protein
MTHDFLLEIAVESVSYALAAQRAGAHRIELCADLSVGGLTPPREMLRQARTALTIPIFSMIRPRSGDFLYSETEFRAMKDSIQAAKEEGVNGIVLGVLDQQNRVDIKRTMQLVYAALPLPVTFHRAFDATPDPVRALEQVYAAGARRILTSGGVADILQGLPNLKQYKAASSGRVGIVACGRLLPENFVQVRLALDEPSLGTPEYHAALRTHFSGSDRPSPHEFERLVSQLLSDKA